MKNYLLLLALLPALPALAQTAPPGPADAPLRAGRVAVGSDTPPEFRAEQATRLLAGQLSLTPEQTERVGTLELARFREHQALMRRFETVGWPGHDPNVEGQVIEARFNQQLTAVCTPSQNEKRRVMQARFRRLREADSLQRMQTGSPQ